MNDIEILENKTSLISKISKSIENAKHIAWYCNDFKQIKKVESLNPSHDDNYTKHSIEYYIKLFLLKQKQASIHIYNSESMVFDKKHKIGNIFSNNIEYFKREEITEHERGRNKTIVYEEYTKSNTNITIYNTHSNTFNVLNDFVNHLIKEADIKHVKNKTISEVIEKFLAKTNGGLDELKQCITKYIFDKVKDSLSDYEELNLFISYDNLCKSLDECKEKLFANLQTIKNDGSNKMWKEVVKFFLHIINIVCFRSKGSMVQGILILYDIIEWTSNKYTYAISGPIAEILTKDLAPAIEILNNHTFSNFLIIDDRILIDYSGFAAKVVDCSSYISKDMAIYVRLAEQNTFDIKDKYCELNLSFNTKRSNIDIFGNKHFQKTLFDDYSNKNYISYIESPNFNSSKLVQLIKPDKQANKDTSLRPLNYLVITNAPYKNNAALHARLIKELGNEIIYGKQYKFKNDDDTKYETAIDYSEYKINIKEKDDKPFVLSLSPFVYIQEDDYSKINYFFKFFSKEDKKAFDYIHCFFKQPAQTADILSNEAKYMQQELKYINQYIFLMLGIDEKTAKENSAKEIELSLIDIVLLSTVFFHIKQKYKKIQFKKLSLFVDDNAYIKFISSPIKIQDTNTYICLSKKHKKRLSSKEKQIISIEEIIDHISNDFFDITQYADNIAKAIQTNSQEISNKQQLDDIVKEFANYNIKNINTDYVIEHIFSNIALLYPFQVDIEDIIKAIKSTSSYLCNIKDNLQPTNYELKIFLLPCCVNFSFIKVSQIDDIKKRLDKKINNIYDYNQLMHIIIANQLLHGLSEYEGLFSALIESAATGISFINDTKETKPKPKNDVLKVFVKKSTPKEDILNVFVNQIIDIIDKTWITEFEKLKNEFERLQFLKLEYHYDHPYAIKRKGDGVYYPMAVNNTFITFDFTKMLYGSRLQTGGLGEKEALFAYIQSDNIMSKLVDRLLGYICIDEIRAKCIKQMSKNNDKFVKMSDVKFFKITKQMYNIKHYRLPTNDNEKALFDKENIDSKENIDNKAKIYEQYKEECNHGFEYDINPIDAYHQVLDYLEDILYYRFTSTKDNQEDHQKHRRFLKALDIIGKNNIKGLYVGLRKHNVSTNEPSQNEDEKSEISSSDTHTSNQPKRPRIIGRLATTIIMEDGLWIG